MSKEKYAVTFQKLSTNKFLQLKDYVKGEGGRFESPHKRWIVALDSNDPIFLEKGVQVEKLPHNYEIVLD